MIEKYFIYYAIGVMVIYFFYSIIIPIIKKRKNVTKDSFPKIYLNNNSNYTKEQYRKISLGAIYSEQQTAYINSLTTGLDKPRIKEILSEWWGINNSEEAQKKLNYLANKGFRFYFDKVYEAYLSTPEEQEMIIINGFNKTDEDYNEDIQKAYSQLHNLIETSEELTLNKIIQNKDELKSINNVGWDVGRLNFLSRLCYDAEYINENKTWQYLNNAYELAIQNFSSWDNFSKSYVIGRAMWGGKEYSNEEIMYIVEYLLKEEKSPWKQFNLK